jgi:hypothetical protein
MQLPQTPIPVVFKNSRRHNKYIANISGIETIKSNTTMANLPAYTITVFGSGIHTIYRYTGDSGYFYACICISWYTDRNGNKRQHCDLSGGTHTMEELNNFFQAVNTLEPFVSKLYNRK